MGSVFSVFSPVLLHFVILETVYAGASRFDPPFADSTVCTLIAALLVLPAAWFLYKKDEKLGYHRELTLSSKEKRRKVFLLPAAMLLGAMVNLLLSGILSMSFIRENFSNQVQEELLSAEPGILILGLGFLIPAVEELLFRGLVYPRMRQRMSAGAAILFSSALFAVYHGNPIQILFSFLPALCMAWLYEREKWLAVPIAFHIGSNLLTVLQQIR